MKKAILYFVMVALLMASAFAAKSFEITESSVPLTGQESSAIDFDLEIVNDGTESTSTIFYNTTTMELVGPDDYSFDVNFGAFTDEISENESSTDTLTLNVPENQYAGDYQGSLQAYMFTQSDNDYDTVTIDLTVEESESLEVSSTSPTVVSGQNGEVDVTFTNTGNTDLRVFAQITELVKTTDSSQVIPFNNVYDKNPLDYETSETVTWDLDATGATSGTYEGDLTVSYGDSLSESFTHTVTVVIQEVSKSIEIIEGPNFGELVREKKLTDQVRFTIENTGNVDLEDLQLTLDKLVASGVYEIDIAPEDIEPSTISNLAVDETREVIVTVEMPADSSTTTGTLTYTGDLEISGNEISELVGLTVRLKDPVSEISYDTSDFEVGSNNQEREVNITGSFTITNSGDTQLNDIEISTDRISSKNDFEITGGIQTTLAAGQSMVVNYRVEIPYKQPSGRNSIGNLEFISDKVTENIPFYVTAETILGVKSVELEIDDDGYDEVCEEDEFNCDDFEIEAGKKLNVRVELKNDAVEDDERDLSGDMEDVEFTVKIIDIDGEDEDDIEIDSGRFKISAENDNDDTVTINLPDKLPDSDSFIMEITAEGSIEDGGDMKLEDKIIIELINDREDEDVRIIDAYFSPSTLTCNKESTLRVTISNFGTEDIDEARIVVYSEDIDYLNRQENEIELDSDPYADDNEYTATYRIRVPENYNGDIVRFTVWAYHGDSDSDYENYDDHIRELSLSLEPCGTSLTTTMPAVTTTTTTQPPVVTVIDDSIDDDVSFDDFDSTEVPFTETPTYIAILAIIFIVVLGAIITLIIKVLKK